MRRRVAWPGVAVKRAKGRCYHYWTRTKPWTPLPDPQRDSDGFMRKLGALNRLELLKASRAGTFGDAARLYRKSPAFSDRAPNTKRLYGIYLDQLCVIFGSASLGSIRRVDVQVYLMDEHADQRGAANVMLRVMHIVYKWAAARHEGLKDPTVGIEEYDGGEHQPWPEHMVDTALASTDDPFRLAVALHLFTGQRTGDVCAMTWNRITDDNRIPVRQEKTNEPLNLPIHEALAAELALAPRKAIAILLNRAGKPLRPATFREWCTAFGRLHGVKLVPHGLRKNAVNALLEAGCSVAETASITGQSLGMIEHYAKARNQKQLASVAMLKWGAHRAGTGKLSATSKTGGGNG